MPAGLVPLSITLALTAIGVAGLWRVSSTSGATAVFLRFTVPAALAIVLTPAMVLSHTPFDPTEDRRFMVDRHMDEYRQPRPAQQHDPTRLVSRAR